MQDAKTRLSQLLGRVERGEEITIARAGRPIARLVGVEPAPTRKLGFLAGIEIPDDVFFAPLSPDELSEWEGSE